MSDEALTIRMITVDCRDPSRLAAFWSSVTDSPVVADQNSVPGLTWTTMSDPEGNVFCVGNPNVGGPG